ncbi:hypothetical protein [Nostoc sp.]|uniref:hypothetical protein n=1 Tax=Nostoc sp. TaxID=1180 RepID=UPI002FF7FA80
MDFCRSRSNFNCKRSLLVGAFVSYTYFRRLAIMLEAIASLDNGSDAYGGKLRTSTQTMSDRILVK